MDRLLKPEKLDANPNDLDAKLTFKHWLRTFERFITAVDERRAENDPNTDKYGILVNYVSPKVYEYIEETTEYEQALTLLKRAYIKPRNKIMVSMQHLLSIRSQQPGETINEYFDSLHQLAKECEFQAVDADTHKQIMIRDAFIKGLESANIRQRLLEHDDITLQRSFDLALLLDQAREHSSHLHQDNKLASLHEVNDEEILIENPSKETAVINGTYRTKFKKNCFFCKGAYHEREKCPAKDLECFNCGKKGHFARACRSRNRFGTCSLAHNSMLSGVVAGSPKGLQSSVVQATVNGIKVQALIDSGSSESYIDDCLCRKLKLFPEGQFSRITMASTSHSVEIKGIVSVELCAFNNTYSELKLGVMKDLCADLILGIDFMKQHKEIKFKFSGNQNAVSINDTRTQVCNVMAANIEPPRIFRSIPKDCVPVATKSRRYSEADTRFINEEVSKLLKEKIIEPSQSPWRSQVLITKDENHKKRMAIDYSQTVNRFTQLRVPTTTH